MVWNVLAIALSAAALLISSVLAMQQARLMFRANHIPIYMELFSQYRSVEFQEHCRFIVERLAQENVAEETGISGLPDEPRAAAYDVAGLFTEIATLRLLGAIDDRIDSMVQVRLLQVWRVLAPFVYAERKRLGTSNMFWRSFEEFAADVALLPEGSINAVIERHRRRSAVWSARRRNALPRSRQVPPPPTLAPSEAASTTAATAAVPAVPLADADHHGPVA
jgi:hypothetical protein